MAASQLPCPTVLRLLIEYCPATGLLRWKKRPRHFFKTDRSFGAWNARYPGTPALNWSDNLGYKTGRFLSVDHLKAHRAAWAIHFGEWPKWDIDHQDGNPGNNAIENLRDVPHGDNQRNLRLNRKNRTGVCGVFHLPQCVNAPWWAYITHQGKRQTLGYFETIEEARAARKTAQDRLGFHDGHGARG